MKILVTGSNGQLGSEIQNLAGKYPGYQFVLTDVKELDITNSTSVEDFFSHHGPFKYVINCAAYTAVDKAEDEPELAHRINAVAPEILSHACHTHRVRLIHISTDYVFNGRSHTPYVEMDDTDPQSVYGKTKLAGEKGVLSTNAESMIIRTSWLYSRFGHNFVKVMQKYGGERESLNVVFDQVGTPTHAADLAESLLAIIWHCDQENSRWQSGIYHFSNEGVCSWYDFAVEIMQMWNINCTIFPIVSAMYPQKAKRPFYSVLNKQKIKDVYAIPIKHWRESLKDYQKATSDQ